MFHLPLINGVIHPGDAATRPGAWRVPLVRWQMHHTSRPHSKGLLSYPWARLPLPMFHSVVQLLDQPQPGRDSKASLETHRAPLGRPSFPGFRCRSGALAPPRQLVGAG